MEEMLVKRENPEAASCIGFASLGSEWSFSILKT